MIAGQEAADVARDREDDDLRATGVVVGRLVPVVDAIGRVVRKIGENAVVRGVQGVRQFGRELPLERAANVLLDRDLPSGRRDADGSLAYPRNVDSSARLTTMSGKRARASVDFPT